jgi:signal transduction histidine kinase
VADLEQLALGLFPATLGGRPIGVLVREIAAGMPVPVQIDVDGPVEDLSPGLRALTYFFCSECLANMAKHSGASTATVRMNATPGCLTISVSDTATAARHWPAPAACVVSPTGSRWRAASCPC